MPFHCPDGVRFYTFESFDAVSHGAGGVAHAVYTRQGGVSPAPWDTLNLGGLVGDDPIHVAENRRRIFSSLGRDPRSQHDIWLVHGRDVVRADAPRSLETPHVKADALITDRPHVTLLMRFADCVPVLFYDPVHHAAGVAHAGWQGTVQRVAAAAIEAMQGAYGSNPADILAAIGPSIAAHHYPVGPEVTAAVRQSFGLDAGALLPEYQGQACFDLWAANRLVLEQAGVRQIEIAGLCTACGVDDWYSHRAERGKTGRFGLLLALKDR